MRKRPNRNHRAFTLIELVIVITILAILAAVAIPAFQNLTDRARVAGVQGALGGLRSALAIYRANELAENRAGAYPTSAAMVDGTAGNPMENADTPDNPWCGITGGGVHCSADRDGIVDGAIAARTINTASVAGWRYNAANGLIYANTSAAAAGVGGPENAF